MTTDASIRKREERIWREVERPIRGTLSYAPSAQFVEIDGAQRYRRTAPPVQRFHPAGIWIDCDWPKAGDSVRRDVGKSDRLARLNGAVGSGT
jgi:hypothetical protein